VVNFAVLYFSKPAAPTSSFVFFLVLQIELIVYKQLTFLFTIEFFVGIMFHQLFVYFFKN